MAAEQQRPPVAPYIFYHAFRPQIAIYSSPDVDKIAAANGLGNLAQLLKPWEASVERVTLRTSNFASHVVPVFPLSLDDARDLVHTELDALFLDNLSESINKRIPEWLAPMDPIDVLDDGDQDLWKEGTVDELTPWYGYYREKVVSLRPRTEYETFGHPVACMLAVSTANPEPLNAFAELYEATSPDKLFADKPWVDPNVLRYYVLVHDATLGSADEFVPLLEDVRRAYGLHTNMLILNTEAAPRPDSAYIDASQRPQPKPADFSNYWTKLPTSPTLPQFESASVSLGLAPSNPPANVVIDPVELGAKLGQEDVRRIKLFLREFVVQNLAPWLERTTTQLNEQLAANRKGIAGRLFSAGRRYFGSRPASPAIGNSAQTSAFDSVKGFYRHSTQEAQTRKLADFALMIADYRLAAATYELARKDFLNDKAWRYYASATRMTGLLNLLLRKVPGGPLAIPEGDQYLEQAANSPIAGTAQLDGLRAIALYYELYQEQEDWQTAALSLAKFASDMDELPSALMIEQAAMAMLRLQRPARRRFSLLMTIAAHRYQKTGHKSLADRCGRQALTLFTNLDRKDWVDFRNHLERMLGRQAYNDGKPEVALVHFLRIILQHSEGEEGSADQDFLDDLQLAWTRLGDNADQISASERLRLSESIFETSQTTIRAEILNPAAVRSDMEAWVSLEQAFLDTGYPYVDGESDKPVKRPFTLLDDVSTNVVITGEAFVVDLTARNKLGVPVTLNGVNIVFDAIEGDCQPGDLVSDTIPLVTLEPNSSTRVSVTVKASKEGTFTLKAVNFRYNRSLACTESLRRQGNRLFATKAHLLDPTYAEDSSLKIIVKPPQPILQVFCSEASPVLHAGESHSLVLTLLNAGSRDLRDLRVLCDAPHIAYSVEEGTSFIDNSLEIARPSQIPLPNQSLAPGQRMQWDISVRSEQVGPAKLRWLFVFRSKETDETVYAGRYSQNLMVQPSLVLQPSVRMGSIQNTVLSMNVENHKMSPAVEVLGLAVLSPSWQLKGLEDPLHLTLDVAQTGHFECPLQRVDSPEDPRKALAPTLQQLDALLHGRDLDDALSCQVQMTFSTTCDVDHSCTPGRLRSVLTDSRQRSLRKQFPLIDQKTLLKTFPLHMPFNSWAVVFWQLPHLKRHGWHCVEVENMVPPVNIVQDLLHKAFSTVGGGRYEESAQERALLLQQLQNSELGRNVCPVSVCHHAVAPDPETAKSGRTGACLFQVVNRGLDKAICTLELLHNSFSHTSVRWIGRLCFHCELGPGEAINCKARFIRPRAAESQGDWLLLVNNGVETWRLSGSKSLPETW